MYISQIITVDFAREFLLKMAGAVPGALAVFIPVLMLILWQRRAFKKGDMRDVVLMVANIFEESSSRDGTIVMKPRTVVSSRPVAQVFANPTMAKMVIKAARGNDILLPDDAFIDLDGQINNHRLGKKVVDNCSTLAAEGHLRRMFRLPITKCEGYACITLAKDGDMETIRIDIIAKDDLRRFLDPAYRRSLKARANEQSHDDMAAVFEICAREVFDPKDDSVERASNHAFRVSFAFEAQ